MINPIGFSETHMDCRYLPDSLAVMIYLLAFEKMSDIS